MPLVDQQKTIVACSLKIHRKADMAKEDCFIRSPLKGSFPPRVSILLPFPLGFGWAEVRTDSSNAIGQSFDDYALTDRNMPHS